MQTGFRASLSVLKSEDSGESSQRLDIWGRDHCPWSQAGVVGMQTWGLLGYAHVFKYVFKYAHASKGQAPALWEGHEQNQSGADPARNEWGTVIFGRES